ncbi:MAG: citrate synthase [Lentisphaeria bacterium]|jgi:citrate synthase
MTDKTTDPSIAEKTASIVLPNGTFQLPIYTGSEGEKAIDISKLRGETGYTTLDQGYGNTASCKSAITFIDGDKGILRYRGIPIEEFENRPNFVTVAWLLIFGDLPTSEEYARFSQELIEHAHIDERMKSHFDSFPRRAAPMATLSAMINTLSCFHPEYYELDDPATFERAAAQLISKIRTLAAFGYRRTMGLPYIYPDKKLPYAPNFLHMMFSDPYDQYLCREEVADALSLFLILHADHEQNCSTSTVRMVGSSGANLYASCSSGVNALWGPLHGGANVAVIEMLEQIHSGGMTPEAYLEKAKDPTSKVKLMGFGHRVYKNFDPRAKILQKICDRMLKGLNINDPLLDIARKLEEVALTDPYFVERQLYPNVDFYSGIILRAMGIPTSMFTVIFSIGRLAGWIAHWREQHQMAGAKISRPRQLYTGRTATNFDTLLTDH